MNDVEPGQLREIGRPARLHKLIWQSEVKEELITAKAETRRVQEKFWRTIWRSRLSRTTLATVPLGLSASERSLNSSSLNFASIGF
jgi:hypothetical protein